MGITLLTNPVHGLDATLHSAMPKVKDLTLKNVAYLNLGLNWGEGGSEY